MAVHLLSPVGESASTPTTGSFRAGAAASPSRWESPAWARYDRVPSGAGRGKDRLMPEDTRSEDGGEKTDADPSLSVHRPYGDPRPAAVTFATTEHFTLQGARAATISESTGRASRFLMAVSGGLVALGLVATASRVGTAFYAFGLILLPTLTFVGLVTFERAL